MLQELQELGLARNEARIYLALLKLGEALAGRISKETQINRTTTYDALERLIEKGLVTYVIVANRKQYAAVDPERILNNIKQQEQTANKIVPQLRRLADAEQEESQVFRGRKGIRTILNDILKVQEYVAFGSSGGFLSVMRHDFIAFQEEKRRKKIRSRVLQAQSAKEDGELQAVTFAQLRYIPDEFTSPSTTMVYGNKTAIIIWGATPMATVITSKPVADSYRNYFELLWKNIGK